jgi:hypothetical protein
MLMCPPAAYNASQWTRLGRFFNDINSIAASTPKANGISESFANDVPFPLSAM